MLSLRTLFTDPLFVSLLLMAVVTGALLTIIISTARRYQFSDREHLIVNFAVALFSIVISIALTWFSARITSQSEQAKLANSAMRHLELIRRSAERLSAAIGQITVQPSTYSSSDDVVSMRRQIASLGLQTQALKDGVDTAIGDWENILSHDVLKQLPQYSRFSDLEAKVVAIESEVHTLKAESKKKKGFSLF